MKTRSLMVLSLAVATMVPAYAQQNASNAQTQPTQAQAQSADAQNQDSAHQPLVYDNKQGFWGKLNPFARKKYVQRQMEPVRNRVNELDELTAANSKNIKDVDARATEGIRLAHSKANEADQHALEAGNRANQAHQTAQQATTRLQTVEQVVSNYDQYQPTNQTEIRFRSGQSALSKNAKTALDELASSLKGQTGYIIEVQGFAPGSSAASIQSSQKMADAVVRYMVLNHEIPVYRVFTLGMGNAKVQASAQQQTDENGKPAKAYRGPRVQVSVLKNSSIEQLNQQAMATPQQNSLGAQSQTPATPQTGAQGNIGSNSNQANPSAQQPSPETQPTTTPR
jgi:outer membrane protein OmpA-like peptidoglycan-associated protein